MTSPSVALASMELRTAVRSRWLVAMGTVFALACVAVVVFGLRSLRDLGLAGAGAASSGLLGLGVLLPPLLGLVAGAGSIAGARERRSLAMLAAQPVRPATLVVGMFAGLSAAVALVVAAAYGISAIVLAGVADTADLVGLASAVVTTLVAGSAGVAIGLAISAAARNRIQAVTSAVGVWFLLSLGMDLLLAVVVPGMRLGPAALLVAAVLNPFEAARLLGSLTDAGGATALGPFGSYLLDRFGLGGTRAILAAATLGWIVGALAAARTLLARRDA